MPSTTQTAGQPRTTLTIDQLRLSPFNVRKHPDAISTSAIALMEQSLIGRGQLEPILVHPMKGSDKFGAHAGGRRYRAFKNLIERGALPAAHPIAVTIVEGKSDAELILDSMAENIARQELEPYETFDGVRRANAMGERVDQIATKLGQPIAAIERMLRLGNLARPIFEALAAGRIDEEQARAFGATADTAVQLAAWEQLSTGLATFAVKPRAIRAAIGIGDEDLEKLLLFVGEDAYVAAGGRLEPDLFGDGPGGRPRIVDAARLRAIADAALDVLRGDLRGRTGRSDLKFVAQPPRGSTDTTDYQLQVHPRDGAEGSILLPEGEIVARVFVTHDGRAGTDYWWASRSAKYAGNRSKYWLDKLRREDGTDRSPSWYVFWYDPAARREASVSTGTTDADEACRALDRRFLTDRGEAPAYCEACGQPLAQADAYLLSDAIADYQLEHGDLRGSADSIDARLKHVLDFVAAQEDTGGAFGIATSCAIACGTPFITAFRAWSKDQPVTWRNKDGAVTVSRPRAAATTEESVLQVAAALNHAADADPPRSDRRPVYKPLPRKQVSRPRRHRVDVPVLADMLAYAAEPAKKRASLHAFIIGSLCTMARPDSVVDISVAPEREQWFPGSETIDLNPFGRAQTNKYRPVVPVLPTLAAWLTAEFVAYERLDRADRKGAGFLVNYYGRSVLDVDTSWRTMLRELKLPSGREWKPYLLRHSLATIVRNRGVAKWDLEGWLGHGTGGSTEVYAIGRFATVFRALEEVLGEIEARAPDALRRNRAEMALTAIREGRAKMPG